MDVEQMKIDIRTYVMGTILLMLIIPVINAQILLQENFDDLDFEARGWYDAPKGELSTTEHVLGSTASFMCTYLKGTTSCLHGSPKRHKFTPSDTIYLSYWVKYSDDYIGSGVAYHPHEFMIMTNKDNDWVGPAGTHLTAYVEQVGGRPLLGIQDLSNVNPGCIVKNNENYDKCDSYDFGDSYSVASCNGVGKNFTSRDCFQKGNGWYSHIGWFAADNYFNKESYPDYDGRWHFVEAMWQMNSFTEGKANHDAKIRYWLDGKLIISSDSVLLRNENNYDQKFDQLLIAPYMAPTDGSGSPVTQTMWIDNLTISSERVGYLEPPARCTDADSDSDGMISNTELDVSLSLFLASQKNLAQAIDYIVSWKKGC